MNTYTKKYKCDQTECQYQCKTKYLLKSHKAHKHNIDAIFYKCDQTNCEYQCKTKQSLKIHKANKHNIDVIFYKCDQTNCYYQCKRTHVLKTHKSYVHDIDVTYYHCNQDKCKSKFKRKCALKRHQAYLHNIGENQCDSCLKNINCTIAYNDSYGIHNICRTCYRRWTGKESRIETQMSNFLDNIDFLLPFLIGSDISFKNMGGCQRYRPDKLYASANVVLHIECDEFQHKRTNIHYSCDEKRISDCYDEFPGKKYIVIRWNPHTYKTDGTKLSKKERFEVLKRVCRESLDNPPEEEIFIYYLFYDNDNPLLAQNIKYKLIYE